MRLREKVAVITGGGTGIGKGIAECFYEEGASLVLAQRRLEVAGEVARGLDPTGSRVYGYQVDISRMVEVRGLIDFCLEKFRRIDVLVNNASITGSSAIAPFLQMDEDFISSLLDVNLKGTVYCSQLAARAMKKQGSGVIIHVSSVGAFAAQEGASVYCATKSAMTGLTQAMALELIQHGIRVNSIAPGDIEIETNRKVFDDLRSAGVSGKYFRKVPINRRGSPREIGKLAVFLASDEAGYILGQTIIVDGGFLIY